MKLKRVKGGKGKRWRKGHSCASNPENQSFREQAKGSFFQKLDGNSGLTVEALAKHTAALEVGPKLVANAEDDKSIGRTFKTFATNFSTCTIPAFENFFKSFNVDSDHHTRMLAIHAAAQEYIQDAKLLETSTSYMCALMASLEGVKDSEDDVAATLSLLSKVIKKVSGALLKAKFGEYSKLLDSIFTSFSNTTNSKLLINVIGCLGTLLRAQDEVQWTYPFTMNLFQKILSFTTHENGDIRRSSQYNASAVLTGSCFMLAQKESCRAEGDQCDPIEEGGAAPSYDPRTRSHPAAVSAGKFVILNTKLATQSMNGKATLYLLIFLQQIINSLPEKLLENCCSRVLGVMHIGDTVVNKRSFKVLGEVLGSSTLGGLSAGTTEALINVLTSSADSQGSRPSLRLVPGMNDAELNSIWMDVVASGIVRLTRLDEALGIEHFSSWFDQLTSFWKSEYEAVHEKVWHTIDFLFDEVIYKLKDKTLEYTEQLLSAFKQIEKCLSLQFQPAWPYVFSSFCPFFRLLGPLIPSELILCLRNLTTMMDNTNCKGKTQLEKAVGAAINRMSPEEVMKVVPLQITGNIKIDETHFWILPVLKKFVKNSNLCFFESHFVHLATKCFVLLDSLKKQGKLDSLLGKTYQLIEHQIWALLPSFADGAVDLEKALSIQSFAKLICDHIKLREDTRIDVMAGLRNMIAGSDTSGKLCLYGKNYIPALFNVFLMKPRNKVQPWSIQEGTVDSGQRLSALTTIEAYLHIIPSSKHKELFDLIIKRYESEESDEFRQKALLTLARVFLPYVDTTSLGILFSKAEIGIKSKSSPIHKICYRILEDLLSTDVANCKKFVHDRIEHIYSLISSSVSSVASHAKATRLKCLGKMLSLIPHDAPPEQRDLFWRQVVKESVNCCGRQNSSTARKAAFALLSEVGKNVQETKKLSSEDTFLFCFDLFPNIVPPSDCTADTLTALIALSYLYKDKIPLHTLQVAVEDVSSLLTTPDRNVVKSSLSFLRLVFSLYPASALSDHVDAVAEKLIAMPDVDRKKFRIKIRTLLSCLIRKFGANRIRNLMPETDAIHRMLTNVIKKVKRERRTKMSKTEMEEEEEEEEEEKEAPTSFDEILNEIDKEIESYDNKPHKLKKAITQKRNKTKTWIKEDEDEIVDLLDASFGDNLLNKKPKVKQLRFQDSEETPQTEEEKYGFRLDKKSNKFIIVERERYREEEKRKEQEDDVLDDLPNVARGSSTEVPPGKRKRTLSEGSIDSTRPATKYAASESNQKKRRVKFDYGAEFRAKKAGGDVSKKGGIAPYAYVQFSKDKLNRRKRAKYAGQFKSLVKGARRGAARGSKGKARKK